MCQLKYVPTIIYLLRRRVFYTYRIQTIWKLSQLLRIRIRYRWCVDETELRRDSRTTIWYIRRYLSIYAVDMLIRTKARFNRAGALHSKVVGNMYLWYPWRLSWYHYLRIDLKRKRSSIWSAKRWKEDEPRVIYRFRSQAFMAHTDSSDKV
jgi:hypothetical protein